MDIDNLIRSAVEARENAVAPYSKFKVGCVVVTAAGRRYTGANIEVSSYGLTMCAERVALFKCLSEGDLEINVIIVVADTEDVCYPCGACRQVISDYAAKARVICANLKGKYKIYSADDLLPNAFSDKDLTLQIQH